MSSNLFKKTSAGMRPATKLFAKANHQATRFFAKNGEAQNILSDASDGFRKIGSTLNHVNAQTGKVLSSPITEELASSMGARSLLSGARKANAGLGLAANLSSHASAATNRSNYHGSSGDVVNSVLERGDRAAKETRRFQFQ